MQHEPVAAARCRRDARARSCFRTQLSGALGALLISVTLVTLTACSSGETQQATAAESRSDGSADGAKEASARRAIPVETWNIEARPFQASFEVPGVVTAERDVRVSFESAGRVAQIYVDAGDTVERGDLLARVSTEVDQARIELLNSQVDTAKREYNRVKNLADEGLASERELDQADSQLESARLNLKQAKVNLNNATITAPIGGQIAARHADEGEFASPGTPLVEIVDASRLQLEASVPESRIEDLSAGMTLEVELPTLGADIQGTVPYMPTRIESRTRTYPVEVQLPADKLKTSGVKLRPGMRANITVPFQEYTDATVIPRTAVLLGYNQNEVVTLSNPDADVPRATIQVVELGPSRGNRVVAKQGLQAGDTIVVRGHRALTDGAPVEVVETFDSLSDAESR
jgi:membrane fusion protein (multidrug efflux system)